METIGRQFPRLVDGLIKVEEETKMKKTLSDNKNLQGESKIEKGIEASSTAQSGTKYMDINFEKVSGELK